MSSKQWDYPNILQLHCYDTSWGKLPIFMLISHVNNVPTMQLFCEFSGWLSQIEKLFYFIEALSQGIPIYICLIENALCIDMSEL